MLPSSAVVWGKSNHVSIHVTIHVTIEKTQCYHRVLPSSQRFLTGIVGLWEGPWVRWAVRLCPLG
jgi:hypothetical protein